MERSPAEDVGAFNAAIVGLAEVVRAFPQCPQWVESCHGVSGKFGWKADVTTQFIWQQR